MEKYFYFFFPFVTCRYTQLRLLEIVLSSAEFIDSKVDVNRHDMCRPKKQKKIVFRKKKNTGGLKYFIFQRIHGIPPESLGPAVRQLPTTCDVDFVTDPSNPRPHQTHRI